MSTNPKSTNPDDLAFSRQVKMGRAVAGVSRSRLGYLAGGVDPWTIGHVENDCGCTLKTAVRLAGALGLSLDHVFGLPGGAAVARNTADPVERAFAQAVMAARAALKATQAKVAIRAGLSDGSHVSWVENGHGATLRTAVPLARALRISLDELFGLGCVRTPDDERR